MAAKATARSPTGGMIGPRCLPTEYRPHLTSDVRHRRNIKKRTNGNEQNTGAKVKDTFAHLIQSTRDLRLCDRVFANYKRKVPRHDNSRLRRIRRFDRIVSCEHSSRVCRPQTAHRASSPRSIDRSKPSRDNVTSIQLQSEPNKCTKRSLCQTQLKKSPTVLRS